MRYSDVALVAMVTSSSRQHYILLVVLDLTCQQTFNL